MTGWVMEDDYVVMHLDGAATFVVTTRRVWDRHYEKTWLLVAEGLTRQEAQALANLLRQGERDEP